MAAITPRDIPSGTEFTWELRKPHPGLLQFVIVFPGGDHWVWREVEFHDTSKVGANQGAEVGFVPVDWLVETEAERKDRNTIVPTLDV